MQCHDFNFKLYIHEVKPWSHYCIISCCVFRLSTLQAIYLQWIVMPSLLAPVMSLVSNCSRIYRSRQWNVIELIDMNHLCSIQKEISNICLITTQTARLGAIQSTTIVMLLGHVFHYSDSFQKGLTQSVGC